MPLVCLHATAYSSQSFVPLMQAMGGERQIIAIDAPGYGDSDAPPEPIAMADYAQAILAALDELVDGPAALLGYHTGCYVATEMGIARPDRIDRIVLIGVPFFEALDLDLWKVRLNTRHQLTEQFEQFAERWAYFVTRRHSAVPLDRAFANFIDEIKAWPNGWRAHEAMFAYASKDRLSLVRQPILILNPDGHLAPASRAADQLISDCALRELPDLSGPVLEVAPDRLSIEITEWLRLSELATR